MPQKKAAAPAATRAQRQASITEIETRLALFGVTRAIQQVGELLDLAAAFVESGEGSSGAIAIPEIGRRIEYRFVNRADPREPQKSDCVVAIKTNPGVAK